LKGLLATTVAGAAAAVSPGSASAGVPELDSTGELYTPKSEMLTGGSEAARGIPLSSSGGRRERLKPGEALQNVYPTRFIAYLSRFLLNFDAAAHAWWVKNGQGDTWESVPLGSNGRGGGGSGEDDKKKDKNDAANAENLFAEFAESVEFGLANYFWYVVTRLCDHCAGSDRQANQCYLPVRSCLFRHS